MSATSPGRAGIVRTAGASGPSLIVVPGMVLTRAADGGLSTTAKFVEGMREYARWWPGPVTALMRVHEGAHDHLDAIPADSPGLGFEIRRSTYKAGEVAEQVRGAGACLLSGSAGLEHIASVCRRAGVPCVVATENTFRTRIQMARAENRSAPWLARHVVWQVRHEQRLRRAVRDAAALQCNGTPTFDAYRALNADTLLYFDTRVRESMLASDADIDRRPATGPLRLVFTGRLVPMKGVDHLPEIAGALVRRGVDFTLTVCGDGALGRAVRARTRDLGLDGRVHFAGVLSFATELVPFVRERSDVFVCCHRQGDPSCTYLETMSCGVPIAGYANEAMVGLARESGSGWTAPIDDVDAMADLIARLAADRSEIAVHARRALAFARLHTFEKTFARRVEHVARAAGVGAAPGPARR